jgi:hypothetical protein
VGEFVFVDEAPDCCDALPGSVAVLHRLFPLVVVLLIGIVLPLVARLRGMSTRSVVEFATRAPTDRHWTIILLGIIVAAKEIGRCQ